MLVLSLKNIILKKDFSPVKMGMTENKVTKLLGKPSKNNRHDDGYGLVMINYGGYEFAFFNDELWLFQNDGLSVGCLEFENKHFKIDTWIFGEKSIYLDDFLNELKKENVKYSINHIDNGEYILVTLSNNMGIEFDKNQRLFAIRYK